MEREIRSVTEDEWASYSRVINGAFGNDAPPEEIADWRSVTDLSRTVATFEDGEIVGTAGAWNMELTLPGLVSVPVAGVTAVGVRTTHRRRGVLRGMMAHQLDDVAARGESIAILTASEGAIYGRFGYGLASFHAAITVERDRSDFIPSFSDPGRVRMIDAETAGKVVPDVHERCRRVQPGDVTRSPEMWALDLRDRERDRRGLSAAFYAIHEDGAGVADGYVRYRFKHAWHHGLPNNEVHVMDVAGTDAVAEGALWRFLLDIDLVRSVHAFLRPVDEPLRWLLADPRQVRTDRLTDDVWVRLVDVAPALAARRYAAADQLTIEVTDAFRPANDGRYRLDGGPDGAMCTRTDDPADIACGVADLGALYLGGVRARSLARAGRIEERTAGALARLDAMVATDPPPLCRSGF